MAPLELSRSKNSPEKMGPFRSAVISQCDLPEGLVEGISVSPNPHSQSLIIPT
jgi:hypothetical protein